MLQGEQETSTEDFEEAEGSLVGASQVLQALELELEGLMVGLKISAPDYSQDQLNELHFLRKLKSEIILRQKFKFGLVDVKIRSRLMSF